MTRYYVLLQSKSYAYRLYNRFRIEGVQCEVTNIPREITTDLCNIGIRLNESEYASALTVIGKSGFSSYKVYKEILQPQGSKYVEVTG